MLPPSNIPNDTTRAYPVDLRRERQRRRIVNALDYAIREAKRAEARAEGEDRSPSLSWRFVDGKALVKCHAGCTFDEIRRAAA